MPIFNTMLQPFGNIGMTRLGTTGDDGTVNIPMGMKMKYDGIDIDTLYICGNSWVGFGSATQHLNINNKDTSYNALYYKLDIINGVKCFRVRFEGNVVYNAWNSNNLIWELLCFENGNMNLIIEKNDGGGTSNFDSKGNGTLAYGCQTGKSYALTSETNGKNYSIAEGYYMSAVIKYLIQDGIEIKAYDDTEKKYKKVADLPLTSQMFKDFGNSVPNPSRVGIVIPNPQLLMWCENPTLYDVNIPKVYQTGVPIPKLVKMTNDETFEEPYITGVKKATIQATLLNDNNIKFVVGTNAGTTWSTWYNNAWLMLDINNMKDIKDKGMTKTVLEGITETQWKSLNLNSKKIRFAYYIEQAQKNDTTIIRQIKIDYTTQGV